MAWYKPSTWGRTQKTTPTTTAPQGGTSTDMAKATTSQPVASGGYKLATSSSGGSGGGGGGGGSSGGSSNQAIDMVNATNQQQTTVGSGQANLLSRQAPPAKVTAISYDNGQKQANYDADVLRGGRVELFGGKSYFELNPVERRGTGTITKITPYSNEEVATNLDFYRGSGIVLEERRTREINRVAGGIQEKYQGMVTSDTTEPEFDAINLNFQNELRSSPEIKTIDFKYNKLQKKAEWTAVGGSLLDKAPMIVGAGVLTAGIGSVAVGLGVSATAVGSAISTTAVLGGGYGLVKTFSDPSSLKYYKNEMGGLDQRYTPSATANIALSGVTLLGGAYGLSRANELSLFNAENTRISNSIKIPQPTFEFRMQTATGSNSLSFAKMGKVGIGTAEVKMVGVTSTTNTPSGFDFNQRGIATIQGEYSWNYPWGNKFKAIQVYQATGSGINMPSQTSSSFSLWKYDNRGMVSGGVVYNKVTPKLTGQLTNSFKFERLPTNEFYLSKATPIKAGKYVDFGTGNSLNFKGNLFTTSTERVAGLSLNKGGNWGAVTDQTMQRGFLKVISPRATGGFKGGSRNLETFKGGNSILKSIQTGGSGTQLGFTEKSLKSAFSTSTATTRLQSQKSLLGTTTRLGSLTTSTFALKNLTSTLTKQKTSKAQLIAPAFQMATTNKLASVTGTTMATATLPPQTFKNVVITGGITPSGSRMFNLTPNLNTGWGLPAMAFPDFGFDGSPRSRGLKGGKRRSKYTPSFAGLIFNVKGSQPKGLETGARIRPIPKGFKWTFSKGGL